MKQRHHVRLGAMLVALALALFGLVAIAPTGALAADPTIESPTIKAAGFNASGAQAQKDLNAAIGGNSNVVINTNSNVMWVVFEGTKDANCEVTATYPGLSGAKTTVFSSADSDAVFTTDSTTGVGYAWFAFSGNASATADGVPYSGSGSPTESITTDNVIAAATYTVGVYAANLGAESIDANTATQALTISGLTYAAPSTTSANAWTYQAIPNAVTDVPAAGANSVYGMPGATVTLASSANVNTEAGSLKGQTLNGWTGGGSTYNPGAVYTFGNSGTLTLTPVFGATVTLALDGTDQPGFSKVPGSMFWADDYIENLGSMISPDAEELGDTYNVGLGANNTLPELPVVANTDNGRAFIGWYTYDATTKSYTLYQEGSTVTVAADGTTPTLYPLTAPVVLAWAPTADTLVEGFPGDFALSAMLNVSGAVATGDPLPQVSTAAQSFFEELAAYDLSYASSQADTITGLSNVSIDFSNATGTAKVTYTGSGTAYEFTVTPSANFGEGTATLYAKLPHYNIIGVTATITVKDAIVVNVSPAGTGTIQQSINDAGQYELVAVPEPGYTFSRWTNAQGNNVSMNPLYVVDNAANAPFTAWFDKVESGSVPVYRLYNPYDYLHLYTSDANEVNRLQVQGWVVDFNGQPCWYAPAEGTDEADFLIIRLYNPYSHDHYFVRASDSTQIKKLLDLGWQRDSEASYLWSAADQPGNVEVQTLFNPYARVDTHLYTPSQIEVDTRTHEGWELNTPIIWGVPEN